jgi:plastocyanin
VRHPRALLLLTATIGLGSLAASTAFAAAPKPKTVAFTGSYAGQVTEKVDGSNVTALTNGTGTGTVIGKGTLTGTVTATTANPPCSPLAGTGTITGAKGTLKVTVGSTSRGCAASETDQTHITVSGTVNVTGGTLLFNKAKGSIHFSGAYDRTSGAFDIKLTGKLVVVSASRVATSAKKLTGTVGPGFTISMSAKTVKAGKYVITIHDKSAIHNFHLKGPGVNKKTSVNGTGTFKWTITLRKGVYTFLCDHHPTTMHGTLKVA